MAWKLFKITRHTSFAALPALVKGALMFITDENRLCIHNGSGWDRVAHKAEADAHAALTAAGTHGSTVAATANRSMHRDASGRSQVASPSADADVANKGWTRDFIYPVGSYYAQYPDASSNTDATEFPTSQRPATLFGGTWAEQWATESVYFRTRGTLSDDGRTNGRQEDAIILHYHRQWMTGGATAGSNAGVRGVDGASNSQELAGNYSTRDPITTSGASVSTAGETRVVNRRIKVWKRTA